MKFSHHKFRLRKIVKLLLIAAGSICVGLGVLGMFVPMLPTVPFLVLASICYARGSDRCYRWLTTNRLFSTTIKNYQEGKGITLRQKMFILLLLWASIGYSALVVVSVLWIKIVLFCIAAGVTLHLFWIKTYKPNSSSLHPRKSHLST